MDENMVEEWMIRMDEKWMRRWLKNGWEYGWRMDENMVEEWIRWEDGWRIDDKNKREDAWRMTVKNA